MNCCVIVIQARSIHFASNISGGGLHMCKRSPLLPLPMHEYTYPGSNNRHELCVCIPTNSKEKILFRKMLRTRDINLHDRYLEFNGGKIYMRVNYNFIHLI